MSTIDRQRPHGVEEAEQGAMAALSRTEQVRHSAVQQAEALATTALRQQQSLLKQLPQLRARVQRLQAALDADPDELAAAEREYLSTVQDAHRAEQAYQQARRQGVITR